MITEQERIIRKSQGYDIGFEHDGKKYWINSNTWDEEKEKCLYKETGLKSFRETEEGNNLVFYNPDYFEERYAILRYKGDAERYIPQPINMSTGFKMFSKCNLREIDLSDWNMSNVTDVSCMFMGCENLQSINLVNWDTKHVECLTDMFYLCENLQSLDLGDWDVSNVLYMDGMFYGCTNLQDVNLSDWNINSVANMRDMFSNCENLQSLCLANWDTRFIKEAGNIIALFKNCTKLQAKYKETNDETLMQKIIEDSNKELKQLKAF